MDRRTFSCLLKGYELPASRVRGERISYGKTFYAKRISGMPGHVNLIPLNDVVESPFKPSKRVAAFQKRLQSHGVTATVRRSLGGDIDASCGQLRRKAMEEGGCLHS